MQISSREQPRPALLVTPKAVVAGLPSSSFTARCFSTWAAPKQGYQALNVTENRAGPNDMGLLIIAMHRPGRENRTEPSYLVEFNHISNQAAYQNQMRYSVRDTPSPDWMHPCLRNTGSDVGRVQHLFFFCFGFFPFSSPSSALVAGTQQSRRRFGSYWVLPLSISYSDGRIVIILFAFCSSSCHPSPYSFRLFVYLYISISFNIRAVLTCQQAIVCCLLLLIPILHKKGMHEVQSRYQALQAKLF